MSAYDPNQLNPQTPQGQPGATQQPQYGQPQYGQPAQQTPYQQTYPTTPHAGYTQPYPQTQYVQGGNPQAVMTGMGGDLPKNKLAKWALALAILSICCTPVAGVSAYFAIQARQAEAEGLADNGTMAKVAIGIDIAVVILAFLLMVLRVLNS